MGDSAYNVLGLPDLEVVSQHYETRKHQDGYSYDVIVYTVKHIKYRPQCPFCTPYGYNPEIQKHNKRVRLIRDLDAHGMQVELEVPIRRYKCLACEKTFTEQFQSFESNAQMTNRFKDELIKRSLDRPFLQVANDYGVTHTTVRDAFSKWIFQQDTNREIYAPEILGIDEAHLAGKMRGVFTDNKDKQLLDILQSRDSRLVKKFLQNLKNPERLKAVTIDMYKPYRAAVYEVFGTDVAVVIDHFHVIQALTNAANDARIKAMSELDAFDRKQIQDDRRLLLTNLEDLREDEQEELARICKLCPELEQIYSLKESFRSIYNEQRRIDAEYSFSRWANSVPQNNDIYKSFIKIIDMVKRWHTEIFNYFDYDGCSNAFTECYNGLIKKTNRAGNGYSFDVLRAKMLYGTSATNNNRYTYKPDFSVHKMSFTESFTSLWDNPFDGIRVEKGFGVDIQQLSDLIENDQFFTEDNEYLNPEE